MIKPRYGGFKGQPLRNQHISFQYEDQSWKQYPMTYSMTILRKFSDDITRSVIIVHFLSGKISWICKIELAVLISSSEPKALPRWVANGKVRFSYTY